MTRSEPIGVRLALRLIAFENFWELQNDGTADSAESASSL
jgi:hypothetical protein